MKGQKSNAIAFTYRHFQRLSIFHTGVKKKQKRKAIAFTFRPFSAAYCIFHKGAKKEGYSPYFSSIFSDFSFFINGQKTAKK
jgi:hypothetical protein